MLTKVDLLNNSLDNGERFNRMIGNLCFPGVNKFNKSWIIRKQCFEKIRGKFLKTKFYRTLFLNIKIIEETFAEFTAH